MLVQSSYNFPLVTPPIYLAVNAEIANFAGVKSKLRQIELLAPARTADIAIEAIRHGADAVYIGGPSHGARSAAANSVADLQRVVDFAHQFRARVYVTLNTLVYDNEIAQVESLVESLYRIGVDALIVQDLGLLRMKIPPIALHASTQTDIRTPEKARFLAAAGFSQLVLPRELTLAETREIARAVPGTALEAFVHGALCVSYSGDCQAGFVTQGRSANRGECPQICRHKFTLEDASGRAIITDRHLLSLRDLNRSSMIAEMMDAGISSFKIEGRLKDAAYVKETVGAYRRIIDEAIAAAPARYERSSIGVSELSFSPDLSESFNRGYTTFFTRDSRPAGKMASVLTPKFTGVPIGRVIASTPRFISANLNCQIANGDGLGYLGADGQFCGFRVNRVEGNRLFTAEPRKIPVGTELFRNHNRLRQEKLASSTATRTIPVAMTLRPVPAGIALDAETIYGQSVTATLPVPVEKARSPQAEAHRAALSKTGDTVFSCTEITDNCNELFIPLSRLTALRRDVLQLLSRAIKATHSFDYRQPEDKEAKWPGSTALTYHDNVANHLAAEFYDNHGAEVSEKALEVEMPSDKELRVMTTRYCLRREYGRCLRTPQGSLWPRELYLRDESNRFALEFDCSNCRMHLLANHD